MIRFTLTEFFMAVTLAAILCAFLVSDGCGPHFQRVSSIAFSPDGSCLAVARHDGRDANVSMKLYLRDVSRTISVLQAPSLRTKRVVEQRFVAGNCGPSFRLFTYASPSVAMLDQDSLIVAGFAEWNSGPVHLVDVPDPASTQWRNVFAESICIDAKRVVMATACADIVQLHDIKTGANLGQIQTEEMPFQGVPCLALCAGGSMLATGGRDGVKIWTTPASRNPVAHIKSEHDVVALSFAPANNTLLVASNDALRLYNLKGDVTCERSLKPPVRDAKVSTDGRTIAVALPERLALLDSATLKDLKQMTAGEGVRCLAFSPDGRLLAGGAKGRVVVWDTDNGDRLAAVTPPGRWRPPWTFPAALFVGWVIGLRGLTKVALRSKKMAV